MSDEREEAMGDETLSRAYRRSAAEEPPPALDAFILAAARCEAERRPAPRPQPPWWRRLVAPVGVLGTLVLTVAVVLMVEREQRDLLPTPASGPLPAAAPTPLPAPGPRDEFGGTAEAVRLPEAWIDAIRRLRQAGRETEAQAQLSAFRLAYPDYRLPEDLRGP